MIPSTWGKQTIEIWDEEHLMYEFVLGMDLVISNIGEFTIFQMMYPYRFKIPISSCRLRTKTVGSGSPMETTMGRRRKSQTDGITLRHLSERVLFSTATVWHSKAFASATRFFSYD